MKVATLDNAHEAHGCDRIVIDPAPSDLAASLHRARKFLAHDGRVVVESTDSSSFDDSLQILEKNAWSVHRHGYFPEGGYFLEASPADESVQS